MNDLTKIEQVRMLSTESEQIDVGPVELKYPQDYFWDNVKSIRLRLFQDSTEPFAGATDFYQFSRGSLERMVTASGLPIDTVIKKLLQSSLHLGTDCQHLTELLFTFIFEKTDHNVSLTTHEIITIFKGNWQNQQRKKAFIESGIHWLSEKLQTNNDPKIFFALFEVLDALSLREYLKVLLKKETLEPKDFEFLVIYCVDNLLEPNFLNHAKQFLTCPVILKTCVSHILSSKKNDKSIINSAEKLAFLDAFFGKTFITQLHYDACTVTNKPLFLAKYYIQLLKQAPNNPEKQQPVFKTARLFLETDTFIEYVIALARKSLSSHEKKELLNTFFIQGLDLNDKHIRYLMSSGNDSLCLSDIEALFWNKNGMIVWDDEQAEERCFNTFYRRSDFKALVYKRDLAQIEKEEKYIDKAFENYYNHMTDSLLSSYRNALIYESGDFQTAPNKAEQAGEVVIANIDSIPGIAVLGGTGYIKQGVRQLCAFIGKEIVKHHHEQIRTFFHSEKEAKNILCVAMVRIVRIAVASGNTANLGVLNNLQTIKKNIIASHDLPTTLLEKIDFCVQSIYPNASEYCYAKAITQYIDPQEKLSLSEAVFKGINDYGGWGFFHGGQSSMETRKKLMEQSKTSSEEELLKLIERTLENKSSFRNKSLNTMLTNALLDKTLILEKPQFQQLKNAYESALRSPEIIAVSMEYNRSDYNKNKAKSLALKKALHEINSQYETKASDDEIELTSMNRSYASLT